MGQFGIGQSVTRFDDPRLLKGEGKYLDDINLPNQLRGYVLRSPYAHAKIKNISTNEAKTLEGIKLVLTGEDFVKSGLGCQSPQIPRKRPNGEPFFVSPQPALVSDTVKFVGDYVAFIVADNINQAKDAAELIEVDYEPLPAIVSTETASLPESPAVWRDCPDNISFVHELGDYNGVENAFKKAKHVVEQKFIINRITANSIEARGCIGVFDKNTDKYLLYTGTQGPHAVRKALAEEIFNVPLEDVRVIANDMGGGFGMKGGNYLEHTLCLWASKILNRPVKWVSDREEAILTDNQARDNVTHAALALDENEKFLALKVRTKANLGAYFATDRLAFPAITHIGVLSGPYTTGVIHDEITLQLTNTNQTAPYRGAGRPEAAYVLERMVELAAQKLGTNSRDLRRKNLIPNSSLPYNTGFMYTYDSGEFEENMDICLKESDYDGFEERRKASSNNGKLRGIGLSNTIELAQGQPTESASININSDGHVEIVAGTKDFGQGHSTVYKQMVYSKLGIDTDKMVFKDGDTDDLSFGHGSFGSRSMFMGGSALFNAANQIIEKGKEIAAHVLEAALGDINFENGEFTIVGTDKSLTIEEVAELANSNQNLPEGMETGLFETGIYEASAPTFPNGCHVCELEIDKETGQIELLRYTIVDDVGRVINPLTLKGQIHGGVVQGLGQVFLEDLIYDPNDGQMLTGSFMDYAMPRASDFCLFDVTSNEVPTTTNPVGAKGGGECGTVGSVAAAMNAILDALSVLNIKHLDLPATPQKIWEAINYSSQSQNV